ncbi:MAG: RICIN domain-containing protein, partial [Paludibacteraceae bacterium]|nr:RICIN domain-containing protein [Paludibacteraceae bacterium]
MKKKFTLISLILGLFFLFVGVQNVFAEAGVYVGGHIRRERPGTITKLRNSGFTYVILFNVHVDTDGTLMTDGETICKNGVYVFGNTQPNYINDVKLLKTWPTSIRRIEICIGGWGNDSYDHIRDLINSGKIDVLRNNFRALKEAIPEIDAVNNDDEHCYDLNAATTFHVMMYDLGYKSTLAPYMNWNFWNNLSANINNQRPGACDRILIQCYDGGAGNNPSDWHLNGITLHAGRTNYQSSRDESIAQFQSWKNNNGSSGSFVWVYNDETWDLNQWATRMKRIHASQLVATNPVATFCEGVNYEGYNIGLSEGEYTKAALAAYGITDNDVSSLKVAKGFKVICYDNDDLSGTSKEFTGDVSWIGNDWNDRVSSLKIIPDGVTGLSGICKIKGYNGQFLDLDGNSNANNTKIVQWTDEGEEIYQHWKLTEIETGVYRISAASQDSRGFDVAYGSGENRTEVLLYDYNNGNHQQFIIVKNGDYYQLVARHCGKVLEVPNASNTAGEQIKLWDNNNQNCSKWTFPKTSPSGSKVASIYDDLNYGGRSLDLPIGSFTASQLLVYGFPNKILTSLKVNDGYKITLYSGDNFTGESVSYTSNVNWIGAEWNDKMMSVKIEGVAQSIAAELQSDKSYKIFTYATGNRLLWATNGSPANGTKASVYTGNNTNSQRWILESTGIANEFYIKNAFTETYLRVNDNKPVLNKDKNADVCKWIIVGVGGTGYNNTYYISNKSNG